MVWTAIHWSVNFLFWIALGVFVVSWASNRRFATVHANGTVEFAPSWFGVWALMYIAVRMCFISWNYLRHGVTQPLTFVTGAGIGLVCVGLVFSLPGTVLATDSGLEEIIWLWRNKKISWDEIIEIDSEKKGRTVTVIGAGKTKIIHSSRLPDRTRFLLEIRRHCGENLPADFPTEDAMNSSV